MFAVVAASLIALCADTMSKEHCVKRVKKKEPERRDLPQLKTLSPNPNDKAAEVLDLTKSPPPPKNYVEPRIQILRNIHCHEWHENGILDPSWCDSPDCEYSSGSLECQQYTLMKRLYQVNVALHGERHTKRHLNELELLRTLI